MTAPLSPRATLIEAMQDANDPADALDRMLAAMAGLGLRVVPVDITNEMAWAMELAEPFDGPGQDTLGWCMTYRACIAAAPDVLGAGE